MREPGPAVTRILLFEAHVGTGDAVAAILVPKGYEVTIRRRTAEALDLLSRHEHAALLVDLPSPAEALETLRALRAGARSTPVVVLVEARDLPLALQALRQGADDYVTRPPDPHELPIKLGRVLERHDLGSRVVLLEEELSRKMGPKIPVAHSVPMSLVLERIGRVAPMKATVLVYGESGSGKELVARSIHLQSPRRDQPFVAVNCAALPANLIESELFGHEKGSFTGAFARTRGKFELAHRGTLFLDEIGEMDPSSQAKLLRVLDEKEFMRVGGDRSIRVDVRLIAATNADLEAMVGRGAFRQDLYYRLKVVTIQVPPLRDRRSDIPDLVETFLEELARVNAVPRKTVTADALAALQTYSWPGNVRELKNVLESLLVSSLGTTIRVEDLPPPILRKGPPLRAAGIQAGMTLAEMERELIRRTLESAGGNRTHSAQMLGIGVRTLQRKIQEYGLSIPSKRRRARARALLPRA
jgi:two-component system response regulator HydG